MVSGIRRGSWNTSAMNKGPLYKSWWGMVWGVLQICVEETCYKAVSLNQEMMVAEVKVATSRMDRVTRSIDVKNDFEIITFGK